MPPPGAAFFALRHTRLPSRPATTAGFSALTIRSSRDRFAAAKMALRLNHCRGRKSARLNSGVRALMAISWIANLLGLRLRPGDRVRLSGGYDMEPRWLNGCHSYFGECIGFIPGANGQLAAVIRLDRSISFDSMTGSYVVLQLRYVGARWSKHETVHVELFTEPPTTLQDSATHGLWIESHANYRVEGPNNSFKPRPLRGSA